MERKLTQPNQGARRCDRDTIQQRRPRQNRTTDAGSNNKGGDTMAQNPSDHADDQAPRTLTEYLDKAHASAISPRVRQALAQLKPAFKY